MYCSDHCARDASKRVKNLDPEELRELIWQLPTTQIAKRLGVSDTAVSKWCKKYGIEKPPRGYWMKKRDGRE